MRSFASGKKMKTITNKIYNSQKFIENRFYNDCFKGKKIRQNMRARWTDTSINNKLYLIYFPTFINLKNVNTMHIKDRLKVYC